MARIVPVLLLLSLVACVPPPPGQDQAIPSGFWDCSTAYLARGQALCRWIAALPPPEYCSRALGGVDCWADPAGLPNRPRALADNPPPLLLAPLPPPLPPPLPVAVPVPILVPVPVPVPVPLLVPGAYPGPPPPAAIPQPPPVQTGTNASHAQHYEAL